MANLIVIAIVLLIVGLAIVYIIKEKKRGVKCIGCPAAGACQGGKGGRCSGTCHSESSRK